MQPNQSLLTNVRQVAAERQYPRDWLYDLARQNALPGAVWRGRRLYIVRAVFEAAVANGWPASGQADSPGGTGGSAAAIRTRR